MGGSRGFDGAGGGAFDRHGGSEGGIETVDLTGLGQGLGGSGGGFSRRGDGDLFRAIGAAAAEVERIPAKAQPA